MRTKLIMITLAAVFCLTGPAWLTGSAVAVPPVSSDYAAVPPFISAGAPPLVMLVLGRDHKLYYEAYNDASDLNGDGELDVGFNPSVEYYGYFDTKKCYTYNSAYQRFEPVRVTSTGTCGASGEWSGNFLNYLTMSRMDALRKVLYGGYRVTDTDAETVLERAYIPRDAHTWGKEYESIARDGYDIRDYAPFNLPDPGQRHLFACTSLYDPSDPNYRPLLRSLPNNTHRIWEWVAKERPVADTSLVSSGGRYESYPANHAEFESLILQFAIPAHLQGSAPPANGRIDGGGNPFGASDYYLTVFSGFLKVVNAGNYELAVDGDDAVEVIVDGNVVAGYYGGHSPCNCTTNRGTIFLSAGNHIIEFRHQEKNGGDFYYLWWNGPDSGGAWQTVPAASFQDLVQSSYDVLTPASTITDYVVRVKVGSSSMPEANCKQYPNGGYKPIGILQRHGESGEMFFGLMTGSYAKNTSGGVLRKNIGSISDEINADTGQFTALNGIIRTIDKLRVKGFDYSSYSYSDNCGWVINGPITEGKCRMWGNPVAEMMYEGMRYYAGKASPTAAFTYSGTTDDSTLGLPLPAWKDPFDPNSGYSRCAKPFLLVISDINPSYDSDQLPGSFFASFGDTLSDLNVSQLASVIGQTEQIQGNYYIGDYAGASDTSCAPKNIQDLGKARGLCPEEPTKLGSYYSASIAYFGHKQDVNPTTSGEQRVTTYGVGLSSPLPRIEIPIKNQTITLVPFAKSCGGYGIVPDRGRFQPTNTIVDFFVQEIGPAYGKFRINYEDVEQGADHDMDAIVIYEYQIVDAGGTPVTAANLDQGVAVDVTLTSEYAAGSIIQHCGYIISGTTGDGTYLEVRDADTASTSDPDYFLDTPPGIGPNQGVSDTAWDDNQPLPLRAVRRFAPRLTGGGPAQLLESPLYYAAKWGGFEDANNSGTPDETKEWDKNADGLPDNYFYVVNPLELERKLNESFASILQRTSSGTAASVISGSRTGEGALYQALFYPSQTDSYGNKLLWSGQLYSLFVDQYGNFREDTNQDAALELTQDKIVSMYFDTVRNRTMTNFQGDADGDGMGDGAVTTGEITDMRPIWDASKWLARALPSSDRLYTATTNTRRIWTWVDQNGDGAISDDGVVDGSETSESETLLFDPSVAVNRQIMAPYLMARALLETALPGDHNDLEFSAVEPGSAGENIRIEYRHPGTPNQGLYVTVSGSDVIVNLGTNAMGAITTNAVELASAVNGHATAGTMVRAQLPVNDTGAGLVGAMAPVNLSLDAGAKKMMEYVIGQEKDHWRPRQIEVENGVVRTWKLGDVIYSTPTVIAQPAEDYDLIYGDPSYFNYRQAFDSRRQVVFMGSNDGFLHAFNAGFWNRDFSRFTKTKTAYVADYDDIQKTYVIDLNRQKVQSEWDLGAEIWSYIPQAVLPHLQWLKETNYPHTYMVDLKPRTVDIKFADGSWHTLVICGLRLGGKDISHTDDFSFGGATGNETRTFRSEYFALDVTDPEAPPKLLWSFTHPDLGLTTSFPTVVRVGTKWFVIIGSGPRGPRAYFGESNQNGRVFVLNAENGAPGRAAPFIIPEAASFMADPVAVDVDLASEYVDDGLGNIDVRWGDEMVYIGSTSGSPGAWSGKMYRIKLTDSNGVPAENPSLWTMSTMFAANGPISAAPNITRDVSGNLWVYWGTGRFWTVDDKAECLTACAAPNQNSAACLSCTNTSRRWFFGVKEPRDFSPSNPDPFGYTYATVLARDLIDTTGYKVYEGGYVDRNSDGTYDLTYTAFLQEMSEKSGWMLQFPGGGERSLYQPIVMGGIVTFTTYVPSTDICDYEGESYLWALYYLTGTAYSNPVIGRGASTIDVQGQIRSEISERTSLGTGVGTAPTFHIGAESKVMVQSSTGAIVAVTEETAIKVKSGLKAWKEEF